jgi:hypothetical protein
MYVSVLCCGSAAVFTPGIPSLQQQVKSLLDIAMFYLFSMLPCDVHSLELLPTHIASYGRNA